MYSNDNGEKVIALYQFPPYTKEVTTWYVMIQPYLGSTNVLLCPSRSSIKAPVKLSNWDGIDWPDPSVTDYAINHQLGSEMSYYVGYQYTPEDKVKNPASTVYLADAGMRGDPYKRPGIDENSIVKPDGYDLIMGNELGGNGREGFGRYRKPFDPDMFDPLLLSQNGHEIRFIINVTEIEKSFSEPLARLGLGVQGSLELVFGDDLFFYKDLAQKDF